MQCRLIGMNQKRSLLLDELKQSRPFPSRAAEATVSIVRTADVIRGRMAAAIEPAGITLQQYNVLRILRGSHPDPLPTLEIGSRLIERVPGITRLLDRLEEKHLVRRQRCTEDRRRVHCWITDAGLALVGELDEPVDRIDRSCADRLSDGQLQLLIESLEQIRRQG
jgi:DNA-binding MarR family transcriptional regulator